MNRSIVKIISVLLLIYALPIVIYLLTFGTSLSTSHPRWAEFGTAMAGIYAPIIALSTLVILYEQVSLQKHQYELSCLQQARSDIEFYCVQLSSALQEQIRPGQTVRDILHANFLHNALADLDQVNFRDFAEDIHARAPSTLDVWSAVYPILAELMTGKSVQFEMSLTSAQSKLIAMLSFETCVALDNYHRTRTEGKTGVPYRFSTLLSSRRGK